MTAKYLKTLTWLVLLLVGGPLFAAQATAVSQEVSKTLWLKTELLMKCVYEVKGDPKTLPDTLPKIPLGFVFMKSSILLEKEWVPAVEVQTYELSSTGQRLRQAAVSSLISVDSETALNFEAAALPLELAAPETAAMDFDISLSASVHNVSSKLRVSAVINHFENLQGQSFASLPVQCWSVEN